MSKIVQRTLDVFELFAEHRRPLSLSEASRLLGIPVSSCHDVLQALEERGYVYQLGPRAGYYPTLRMQRLAARIAESDPVLRRAEPLLRGLRDELDESVTLSKIDGRQATYLLVLEPSHPLRMMVKIGEKNRSLHATSVGKAVLGSLPDEARRETLSRMRLDPLTERTVASIDRLEEDLRASRQRGWYLNLEESVPSGTTVSALFAWNGARFIVTIAGPTGRIEPRLDHVVRRLKETCERLQSAGAGNPSLGGRLS